MGAICFSLYTFVLTRGQAIVTLVTIGGTFVLLDVFRLWVPSVNALSLKLFGKIMRREELRSITGNSFYVLGMLVLVVFFPKPVVMLSLIFLALGDPSAAVVGTLYGRRKILGKKSLEGSLANFALCGLAVFVLGLSYFGYSSDHALRLALIGGAISMIAELLPLPIDDNFTIPVSSAILLTLVNAAFPLF